MNHEIVKDCELEPSYRHEMTVGRTWKALLRLPGLALKPHSQTAMDIGLFEGTAIVLPMRRLGRRGDGDLPLA